MSVQSTTELRSQTRIALQEAATLFRAQRSEKALDVLQAGIIIPHQNGQLTDGQLRAVYRALACDPNAPSIDISKGDYQIPPRIRAQALRDLVAQNKEFISEYYSNIQKIYGPEDLPVTENPFYETIFQAAQVLETSGDMAAAWKVLQESCSNDFRTNIMPGYLVKEAYRIMLDDFRTPSSTLFEKGMKFLAKALDSLSLHIFDESVQNGERPQPSIPTFQTHNDLKNLFSRIVYKQLEGADLDAIMRTSKAHQEVAKLSLNLRTQATLKDLIEWRKKGLITEQLPNLRTICRKDKDPVDPKEFEAILVLCPNLEVLDMGSDRPSGKSNCVTRECIAAIGRCCPKLRSFHLARIAISGAAYGTCILQALSLCPELRTLSLDSYCLTPLTAEMMKSFLQSCRNLENLELNGILIGNQNLISIGKAGLPLKRIKLGPIYDPRTCTERDQHSPAAYIALFQGNPHLEEVILPYRSVDNDVLDCLAESCPQLTKLDLTFNRYISEQRLRSAVAKWKHLRHLNIEGVPGNLADLWLKYPAFSI